MQRRDGIFEEKALNAFEIAASGEEEESKQLLQVGETSESTGRRLSPPF